MKKFTIMFAFLLVAGTIFSQGKGELRKEQREKVERLKIAYITERLDLSSEEAQMFWPLYNDREKEIRSIKEGMKPDLKKLKNNEVISEAEFLEILSNGVEGKKKEAEAMESFLKNSLPILGLERTILLIDMDKEFRRKMKERLDERN